MIPAQRQQTILKTLSQREVASIMELAEALGVSHMTVRRDIQSLEQQGRVLLISGGVRLAEQIETEPSRKVKTALQSIEKALIARAAAALVAPGATVYLDAGTTCLAIAIQLAHRNDITVLTNDFAIVSYLIGNSQCELYHTGGHVIRENESGVGERAARFIASVNIDIAFISASSWDMYYISTPTESKAPVKQAAVAASAKKILVSDATKYGKVGFFKAVPLTDLDCIITDGGLDPVVHKAMVASGLDVIIAS
ncbi:putative DNA-binding transcriptional regulator [uncultured delta proteobacterium]|uniref:Putative DNA-binding transcriptional regulator n=1 Tax=uncultured delta proteobacterium TaxID=34034 RepID=A0A212IWZ6_9DELT|nr:putative DNA-binding transcriptional regulator [uncultured delta proteobacterium]